MKRAASLLGPACAYVVYIFVMGSLPEVGPPMGSGDKVAHFVAFGIMVFFVARAVPYFRPDLTNGRRVVVAAMWTSGLGALLEVWQSLIPYRSAEVLDWVADTVGATVAALVLLLGGLAVGAHGRRRGNR